MIECCGLTKSYTVRERNGKKLSVNAVDNVSFTIPPGTSCALVGESGSGKSTLARLICRIELPDSGDVLLDGQNLLKLTAEEMRRKRCDIQLVLQDSAGALNPSIRIADSIAEPMKCLLKLDKAVVAERVKALSSRVGLSEEHLRRFPHELSGGQQKRVCIARALSVSPKLIVFDESTSGLDVTVRKQILDLLCNIQREEQCAYLFITHDIDVALYMADHVMVMKNGKIVENVKNGGYEGFSHEYSKLLISSLPQSSTQIM